MEAPAVSVTVTADEGTEVPSRTIRFQCGLLRETETFVEEDLEDVPQEALLDYVVDMLNVKVWPWQAFSGAAALRTAVGGLRSGSEAPRQSC